MSFYVVYDKNLNVVQKVLISVQKPLDEVEIGDASTHLTKDVISNHRMYRVTQVLYLL